MQHTSNCVSVSAVSKTGMVYINFDSAEDADVARRLLDGKMVLGTIVTAIVKEPLTVSSVTTPPPVPQPAAAKISGLVPPASSVTLRKETQPILLKQCQLMHHNLTLYRGDMLKLAANVLVNSANSHLAHGGGIARVLSDAAGHGMTTEGSKILRGLVGGVVREGSAVI